MKTGKHDIKPPRIPEYLMGSMFPDEQYYTTVSDIEEDYRRLVVEKGSFYAGLWYWLQLLPAFAYFVPFKLKWSLFLFNNYVKTIYRYFRRQKGFTLINILGLAIGMAGILLVLLYVRAELSFDNFHKNKDNIFRVQKIVTYPERDAELHALTSGKMAGALVSDFPEILNAVKIFDWGRQLVTLDDQQVYLENVLSADENFFEIFSFNLLEGNRASVLEEPGTVVLAKDDAEALFPGENPVGKTIKIESNTYEITGIIENPPENSHLRYSMICSWATTLKDMDWLNNWITQCMYTYLLLDENSDVNELEEKFKGFMEQYMPTRTDTYALYLKPINKIHLYSSDVIYDLNFNKGNIYYVYLFPAIALFILAIGCLNFINLSTARSSQRAREVGIRKVVGAGRFDLMQQYIGESVMLSLAAMFLGMVLARLFLPVFNNLTGRQLGMSLPGDIFILIILAVIAVFVGLISGIYPAFVLSSFRPVSAIKGFSGITSHGNVLRKGLVVFQFAITIFLIAGTFIVYNQLQYIRNKNLGFNKDQMVVTSNSFRSDVNKYETQKNRLLTNTSILNVTGSRHMPGRHINTYQVYPEKRSEDENWIVACMAVDFNFIPVMGMELTEGRNFSREFSTDAETAIIINETLAKKLGWVNPLNREIFVDTERNFKGKIIGVVRDFNVKSLHQEIEPLILYINPVETAFFLIRVLPDNIQGTIDYLKKEWKEYDPVRPFQYRFLDETFSSLYNAERNLGKIFTGFTFLALFTAGIGLFGLSTFIAQRRIKEIGIRKVLGASVSGIVLMMSREFLLLVLVSNIAAWPAAYYFAGRWLENFAFKINLDYVPFILSGITAVLIAVITVSFQSFRAASVNPVESLRNE